ncbi:MAG: sugar phosphate isomerase/epimerase [Planctomycetes bacterium]|nr:sugar phosphate isomerase/epimerase [Planctomycetota bacterium]
MIKSEQTRRRFLRAAGTGMAASLMGVSASCGQDQTSAGKNQPRFEIRNQRFGIRRKRQFELGLASYTLRKLKLDETLAMTKRVGLKYIAFKSFHLALDSTPAQISKVVAKVKKAGLILYGGGVIYMKNEAEVHRAFDYAKAAGMKVIIGVPRPELLKLVDKKVRQYDIKVAIHNHGPGDKTYPTPASAYEKIKNLDKRIGLCNDIGHTQRAGVDPSVSVEKHADRLLDVHIKDVSEATAKGHGVEVGRGVIDIPRFLRTLIKINYAGIVSFEYEKDADDPLAGLAESVGYVKGVLAAIS